jgi:hypothetical protein
LQVLVNRVWLECDYLCKSVTKSQIFKFKK